MSKRGSMRESAATPGRPKDSGSRQQTHRDQTSQSGSPKLDRAMRRRGQGPSGAKPASAK